MNSPYCSVHVQELLRGNCHALHCIAMHWLRLSCIAGLEAGTCAAVNNCTSQVPASHVPCSCLQHVAPLNLCECNHTPTPSVLQQLSGIVASAYFFKLEHTTTAQHKQTMRTCCSSSGCPASGASMASLCCSARTAAGGSTSSS